MPENPGVTIVIRRHEEMRKKQLQIEQAKKIRSTRNKKQQKEFEKEKKTNETKGQALFSENDFALAIHFFHLSENWVMKKNAFEKLKFEIQEKLNAIPIPSDTINSITIALTDLKEIETVLSGIIEDQKKLLYYDDYPSFEITENSFQFLLNQQKINFFSYIEELEKRKNILTSLIEKPIIDSDSLLFLDQFKDLHESDDLEKLMLKKSEAQELLKKYKNINKYVTTINTNNFTNLEEFIKRIGRKIKILTLKNQAKTYKDYLENPNLYTDIFNKNPRRIAEIENCFSTYQETLSELAILGDKPNDTEVIIKKTRCYIERMKSARKFLIEDPLNLVKEKIKADKIDKASFEKIEKIIFDLIKTSAIAEQYLSASEEAHIHLQSSICHWIESLMERKFHCVCFFQSKTASLNTKNPALEKDQFLNWFNSDGNPLSLQ